MRHPDGSTTFRFTSAETSKNLPRSSGQDNVRWLGSFTRDNSGTLPDIDFVCGERRNTNQNEDLHDLYG